MSFLLLRVLHFPKYASTTFKISFSLMKEIEEEVIARRLYKHRESLIPLWMRELNPNIRTVHIVSTGISKWWATLIHSCIPDPVHTSSLGQCYIVSSVHWRSVLRSSPAAAAGQSPLSLQTAISTKCLRLNIIKPLKIRGDGMSDGQTSWEMNEERNFSVSLFLFSFGRPEQ